MRIECSELLFVVYSGVNSIQSISSSYDIFFLLIILIEFLASANHLVFAVFSSILSFTTI